MMKLGLVGSGSIINTCLEHLKAAENVVPAAICVRPKSEEKGRAIAQEFSIPDVFVDYELFLAAADIDFVYIGIINSEHYNYAKCALLAGRNVILEKPFTVTAEQADELISLAIERGLYLFEAITSLYCQNYLTVKRRLPELGRIRLVQSNYSQYSARYDNYLKGIVEPVFAPTLSGGALVDINIYNMHITAGLFGSPLKVSYTANRGFNGVDTSGVLMLEYDGFVSVCCGAKDSESPCFVLIQGEKGYMRIDGRANSCEKLTICAGGKTETFIDSRADVRMAAEFEAFEHMWRENDYTAHTDYLRHSGAVMRVISEVSIT